MRIAVSGDIHLGITRDSRSEGGKLVRAMDVERALALAAEQMMERKVELVLLPGDVFDSVTPSTAAKNAYLRFLRTVTASGATVVAIPGNHDGPRTQGVMCPLRLGDVIEGVRVVEKPGTVVRYGDAEIHCYGYGVLGKETTLVPEPIPGMLNILLIHAAVRSSARPGALPPLYAGTGAYDVARAEGFDIIACGDFHDFRVLSSEELEQSGEWDMLPERWPHYGAPLAFYSGSLERVSSNIWQETAPKGWVLVDTEARTLEFVEVATRPMIDWTEEDSRKVMRTPFGEPSTVADLNYVLGLLLEEEGTRDALLRVSFTLRASERDGLDHALVRQLHQRCVHFRLDVEWVGDEAQGEVRTEQRGLSLEDLVEQYAEGEDPAVAARMRVFLGLGEPVLEGASV